MMKILIDSYLVNLLPLISLFVTPNSGRASRLLHGLIPSHQQQVVNSLSLLAALGPAHSLAS